MKRLSRYSFLFGKGNKKFIYNSRSNNFYEISEAVADLLAHLSDVEINELSCEQKELLEELSKKQILQSLEEDNAFVEEQKLFYNMNFLSMGHLSLTILPTVSCNLRCPYCFEGDKPGGIMSDEVIENLIRFIKSHEAAKTFSIHWFGGEPLIGIDQMEKILSRIPELDGKTMIDHLIVTNATLLNDEAIALFMKYPLSRMQVTLDGFREHHDSKRFYSNGAGTFDDILANVIKFMDACPDTYISFRVNVDNTNSDDYLKVNSLLAEKLKGKKYGVYAGILRANRGCELETFFTTKDHLAFNKKMADAGLPLVHYPGPCSKGCCATSVSSYVIGPFGELYNCWEHVGKPGKVIGNIADEQFSNPSFFTTFINKGHCFDDPKCRECGLLPICSGGCANKRIENIMEGAGHDLCTIYNDDNGEALEDLLYQYYLYESVKK